MADDRWAIMSEVAEEIIMEQPQTQKKEKRQMVWAIRNLNFEQVVWSAFTFGIVYYPAWYSYLGTII